jgi:hypothetical protein
MTAPNLSRRGRRRQSGAQKVAQYQPTPKGASRCDNCSQFLAPSACKVVAGKISPSGWCQLYAAK